MFIPVTPQEVAALGWDRLDVILVSGDTYIDSPFSGVALIGRRLLAEGYRVGIIAQPDVNSPADITRLGEPALFWGVSAGTVDSMVANTTALGKPRRTDDYTPGGLNDRRPNRAVIAYSNLVRRYFKNTVPIVLGGIEASLRRVAHYDYWSDSLRRSVLLDAKADYLLYGMADNSVLELARCLRDGSDPKGMRGLVYASSEIPQGCLELPSYEEVTADKQAFTEMFHLFYRNNDPISAKGLAQSYAGRYVVQNPPAPALTSAEMDEVYSLPFEYAVHPYYAAQGEVRAMDTIRFSIPTHRGCYGECNFCAIAVHEGRRVSWRSQESIVAEARSMPKRPNYKGIISDLSAPTANMYGFECRVKAERGACPDKSCIYPEPCPLLGLTHAPHTRLLKALRQVEGVRKVFIGSGIRHDLVMADSKHGDAYLEELVGHHVSGQLKLAPEHTQPGVLAAMRKPGPESLLAFKRRFETLSEQIGKDQYLTYYLISAHPGCTRQDMIALQQFAGDQLGVLPEQVQIFTPTPSTYSSLMYYTEQDPFSGKPIFVEKSLTGKMQQKALITGWRGNKRTQPAESESREPRKRSGAGTAAARPMERSRPAPRVESTQISKGEVRVVRDDFGDYFGNKPPENWRERPRRPARADAEGRAPAREAGRDRPRRDHGRDQEQGRADYPKGREQSRPDRGRDQEQGRADYSKSRGQARPARGRDQEQGRGGYDKSRGEGTSRSWNKDGSRSGKPSGGAKGSYRGKPGSADQSKDRRAYGGPKKGAPGRPAGSRPTQNRQTGAKTGENRRDERKAPRRTRENDGV